MEKKSVIISFLILALLAVGGGGAGVYYFNKYQKEMKKVSNPEADVKVLLENVGKLIDLPTDEEPTVATVTNADQISAQPFFAKAKNGDRVIIYTNARLAILFDENVGKIMNVGTINMGTQSAVQATPAVSNN